MGLRNPNKQTNKPKQTMEVQQLRCPWLIPGRQEEIFLTHGPSPRPPSFSQATLMLCFIDPRVRKIRNEASSYPGIFSRTLRFYYASSPGSPVATHTKLFRFRQPTFLPWQKYWLTKDWSGGFVTPFPVQVKLRLLCFENYLRFQFFFWNKQNSPAPDYLADKKMRVHFMWIEK